MDMKLKIPTDAIMHLKQGGTWTGEVTISPSKMPRKNRVTKSPLDIPIKNNLRRVLKKDEDFLIKEWNHHNYRPKNENRNRPITEKDLIEYLKHIRKAIDYLSVEKLLEYIDEYFETCNTGKHIWDGRNHGYSHLGGLCKGLMNHKKLNTQPFWRVNNKPLLDEHPEFTVKLANEFAKKFLERQEFGIKNTSVTYNRFKVAADRIIKVTSNMPFDKDQMIEYLLQTLTEWKNGQTVHPSNLSSDYLWQVLLPQYLKGILL